MIADTMGNFTINHKIIKNMIITQMTKSTLSLDFIKPFIFTPIRLLYLVLSPILELKSLGIVFCLL